MGRLSPVGTGAVNGALGGGAFPQVWHLKFLLGVTTHGRTSEAAPFPRTERAASPGEPKSKTKAQSGASCCNPNRAMVQPSLGRRRIRRPYRRDQKMPFWIIMRGRYRTISDCPPITQFRKGTEKALDPPPGRGLLFFVSVFYRDPRWRNWWRARRSSSLGVPNARSLRLTKDCRSGTQLTAFHHYQSQ